MARLPDGACQIVETVISSPPPSGVMRTLRKSRSTERGKSNRTIVVLPDASSSTQVIAVGGREERRRIAPGIAQPQLEQRHLRSIGRRLPLGVVDALFAEGADALVTVQGPLAETRGDFGCADLGVEQRQGIGADQRRDAIDLLRQLRGLQFDCNGLEIVVTLGRIGRRTWVVARRQS